MYNKVILVGRLVRDAEVRQTQSGKLVASASLVTSKTFKDQEGNKQEKSEFHNLVIWNSADAFATYTKKGSLLFIEGELSTRSWEKDGQKQYRTEIIVNTFKFLDRAPTQEQTGNTVEQVREAFGEQVIEVPAIPF